MRRKNWLLYVGKLFSAEAEYMRFGLHRLNFVLFYTTFTEPLFNQIGSKSTSNNLSHNKMIRISDNTHPVWLSYISIIGYANYTNPTKHIDRVW